MAGHGVPSSKRSISGRSGRGRAAMTEPPSLPTSSTDRPRSPESLDPTPASRQALRLVLVLGIVSLCADTTYEGWRSISGPFLLSLGASAFVVGLISGTGELTTYLLRPLSGRWTDRLGRPWAIAVPGYVLQLAVVPLLAIVGAWPVAAVLWICERAGKGIRNPPRDAMLSYAGRHVGEGWAFGVHEALDQTGAVLGPLVIALVLFDGRTFRDGLALLAIPAALSLLAVTIASRLYPSPRTLESRLPPVRGIARGRFRLLLLGAGAMSAGLVAFPLISFYFVERGTVALAWVPILYAVGMAAQGASGLGLGHFYERAGASSLLVAAGLSVGSAPLLFSPVPGFELGGMVLWGIGMGAQESNLSAVAAASLPQEARASGFGELQAALGVAGFAGGVIMGFLLEVSTSALIVVAVALGALSVPLFWGAVRPEVVR